MPSTQQIQLAIDQSDWSGEPFFYSEHVARDATPQGHLEEAFALADLMTDYDLLVIGNDFNYSLSLYRISTREYLEDLDA